MLLITRRTWSRRRGHRLAAGRGTLLRLGVGRFISRDPVLSEHPYLYGEHEPVMRVDPSGSQDFALDPKAGRMVWNYDKWQAPPIEWGDWDAGIGIGSPYAPVVKSPVSGAPYEKCDPNIHGKRANLLFF